MSYGAPENYNNPQGQDNNPGATTQTANNSQTYGHPVFDQIGSYIQQATGRRASQQEVSQWGTNVDPNYMNTIRSSIYNSPEAQTYSRSQANPATPPPTVQEKKDVYHPPPPPGSPVTGDGKIPAPGTQQIQYYTPGTPPPGPNDRNVQGMTLDQNPLSTYRAGSINTQTPQTYQPGQLPDSYHAGQLTQFSGPDQQAVNGQQNSLLSSILTNPQTLSPSIIAQMKESQKGDALSMQRQVQQGNDQYNAARGTLGSGYGDAQRAQLQNDTISQILSQNRGLDVNAAQTNRQDQLNALGATDSTLNGQLQRAVSGYNTGLGGQMSQEQLRQAQATSGLGRAQQQETNNQNAFTSRLQAGQFGLEAQKASNDEQYRQYQSQVQSQQDMVQRALAQFGINSQVANNRQQNYGQDLNSYFGQQGLNLQGVQTNNSSTMAYLNYLENQRQFNNQLGFNYNQLDQNGQNTLLSYLMGK